jgi:hypothetical protein
MVTTAGDERRQRWHDDVVVGVTRAMGELGDRPRSLHAHTGSFGRGLR